MTSALSNPEIRLPITSDYSAFMEKMRSTLGRSTTMYSYSAQAYTPSSTDAEIIVAKRLDSSCSSFGKPLPATDSELEELIETTLKTVRSSDLSFSSLGPDPASSHERAVRTSFTAERLDGQFSQLKKDCDALFEKYAFLPRREVEVWYAERDRLEQLIVEKYSNK